MSAAAAPVEVAPGVHRVSVPLPFPPREVAAWVIEGDAGHTLVDTGIDTPLARGALREAAEHVGVTPESLAFVVLTHAHLDHYGLAGPVREWSGARVAVHEREEALVRTFLARWPEDRPGAVPAFLRGGVPEGLAVQLVAATDFIHRQYRELRPDIVLEGDGGPLPGGGGWEWIHTPGHSPGHVTVYHPERRILITGDHVLPRISPHIGAGPYFEDPLAEYLASLSRLRDLPVDLVLPSHGEPFPDLGARVDGILAHHAERNQRVLALLDVPRTSFEVALGVFGELPPDNLLHALRESLAHLVYLAGVGAVAREERGAVEVWRRV
ncbi:MAG TPA: MBL fold metallo-hydrolase [Longimicrobium sp.]|jgi:glyoxylase-like metal-dependent hydrolase (beta-lactamase superfamily II)